jgi:hypothetical protein
VRSIEARGVRTGERERGSKEEKDEPRGGSSPRIPPNLCEGDCQEDVRHTEAICERDPRKLHTFLVSPTVEEVGKRRTGDAQEPVKLLLVFRSNLLRRPRVEQANTVERDALLLHQLTHALGLRLELFRVSSSRDDLLSCVRGTVIRTEGSGTRARTYRGKRSSWAKGK